eukprot:3495538-Pleurochrysis_carterae.AAC.1
MGKEREERRREDMQKCIHAANARLHARASASAKEIGLMHKHTNTQHAQVGSPRVQHAHTRARAHTHAY